MSKKDESKYDTVIEVHQQIQTKASFKKFRSIRKITKPEGVYLTFRGVAYDNSPLTETILVKTK